MPDYYTILGISRNASQREIRDAYLRLAKSAHPDRVRDLDKRSEADRRVQEINEAYNHLRDETLRAEYNKSLERKAMTPQQEAELYSKNGVMREELKEYAEALKLFYEAMRLDPDKITYVLAAARVRSQDRSKQREAAELYEKAVAMDPKSREAYLGLGSLYASSGMITRACRVLQTGTVELPGDSELRARLSEAKARQGQAR